MIITVQATYEDGVLKPATPLQLAEHQQVEVEIRATKMKQATGLKPIAPTADESHLALKLNGDLQLLRKLIEKPEGNDSTTSNTGTSHKHGYGLLGWTGDSETVQRIALDPEFGINGDL